MFKSPIYLPPYITIYPYIELSIFPNFSPHTNKCKKSYNKWDYITTQILLTKHILSFVIFCLLTISYIILNITPAINDFQCLFWFDKSVKKDYIR